MKKVTMLLLLAVMLGLIGCTCPQAQQEPMEPEMIAQPAVVPPAMGPNQVSRMYGTAGLLKIEKMLPEKVQLNSPFTYTIKVTNLSDMMLSSINLKDALPANFKYRSSTPEGTLDKNILSWTMDSLGPNAQEMIEVTGMATDIGWLQTCANATYIVPACAKTQVVQPALALTKNAPAKSLICDNIPMEFVVTNQGTGDATNVVIMDTLPDGLMTVDGQKQVKINVGTLIPGKSATYNVVTKAEKTGTYKNIASAMADGDLTAKSGETITTVTQPVLAIEKTGPKKQYLGRELRYDIMVKNTGDAVAANTDITDTIPNGATDVKASDNGVMTGNQVMWTVGDLAPGQSRQVSVSYNVPRAGNFGNKAVAKAVCADAVSASLSTEVRGIPAVLLEVIDITDPVEVGTTTTYVITVTNQGSAPGTNIAIAAELEDAMEYVSSSGATTGTVSAKTVTFQALPRLAAKAKAAWRVTVKAVEAGDVRFSVKMNSDQIGRDVIETEATNFYE